MGLQGDPDVARAVWNAAEAANASYVVRIALLEACMVESGMRNLNHGDRDSLGVLQQRASWGSVESRMNPRESAERFIAKAQKHEPWPIYKTAGWLAQTVQVSALPGKYDLAYPAALLWYTYLKGSAVGQTVVGDAKDVVAGPQKILDFVSSPEGLRRIALVVVGGGLVLMGARLAFSPAAAKLTKTVQGVVT